MRKKTIGIIGGMGPLATAELFRMIVQHTDSMNDAGHIRILIDNNPSIPDRTLSILGKGNSPVPEIVSSARMLEQMGADFLLLPCNTSHYYFNDIQEQVNVEIINMIWATVSALKAQNIQKCGLLATTGTVIGKVYQNMLAEESIAYIPLDDKEQETVMEFIYSGVKAGAKDFDSEEFQGIVDRLYDRGAQSIILGCTELLPGIEMYGIRIKAYIEPMEVLADLAIEKAGYSVKRQQ